MEHQQYTIGEEIANSITHGIGAALSIAGLVILVVMAALHGDAWHIVSCSIYGASMIMLYTASTLYHTFQSPKVKHAMRILDHSSIYLLIAGTYTPFTLISLRGPWGWSLFGVIWGLALTGIIFKLYFTGRFNKASTIIYVLMGWIAVIAIKPMIDIIPIGGLALLFGGGLSYTLGVIFYVWKKLPYHHAVWHLFVLGGTILHFFAILFFVLPS
ncbi:hemolysin III family protein [bacterium]|nr:MAG: hemolysin III family protein [bacterium]